MNVKWITRVVIIGAAGCIFVGWPLLQRLFGGQRPRFPYLSQPLSEADYGALARVPGWAKSQLEVTPHVSLRGLVRPASNADADWVLYFPGNDRSQLATGQDFLTRLSEGTELGLAVYAYRGYDGSGGKPLYQQLADDAPRILALFCEQQKVSPHQVHLVGFSIGSHFAVMAASETNAAGHPARSLSLLACVNDIEVVRSSPWQKLSPGDRYRTRPLLDHVPAPVLLLQGAADEALEGAQQGIDVARALGERAQYLQFEGVGHETLLRHEPALVRLREFIRSHPR